MITLEVGGTEFTKFNNFSVDIEYDTLTSSFEVEVWFDPENEDHKNLFAPGAYSSALVKWKGEVLITGIILSPEFNDEAAPGLVTLSGYSKTGILEDCPIPPDAYPLQNNRKTIAEICSDLAGLFDIGVVIDISVKDKAEKEIEKSAEDPTNTIGDYIADICGQNRIILSHTSQGDIYLTSSEPSTVPVFNLEDGPPAETWSLSFDGQSMHSQITVQGQSDPKGGNKSEVTVKNPLVKLFRPTVIEQTSGDDTTVEEAANNALADELKNVSLKIDLDRWEVDGKLLKPNMPIMVKNPRLMIYDWARFIISEVSLNENESNRSASITCNLPEVYTKEEPVDIFG